MAWLHQASQILMGTGITLSDSSDNISRKYNVRLRRPSLARPLSARCARSPTAARHSQGDDGYAEADERGMQSTLYCQQNITAKAIDQTSPAAQLSCQFTQFARHAFGRFRSVSGWREFGKGGRLHNALGGREIRPAHWRIVAWRGVTSRGPAKFQQVFGSACTGAGRKSHMRRKSSSASRSRSFSTS